VSGEPARPDPDLLLAATLRDAARERRGKLRIFFGASAGVGKTYAMLEAARAARTRGVDVVVGYVEPHGRIETERLLEGLERLPTLPVAYGGTTRQEFDLDRALQRRAAITLVDELAHSNVEGGAPRQRHGKRWQDVAELLDAGLDVWTTVNVQHLESLNDVVAGITGVRQSETLPDSVFDEADEVELIDLPPDDLLERLRAGKIYLPEQARRALEKFFRKPNLIALRELALRRTADRVDASALEYAGREVVSRPWLARDRFLIAVAPDAQGESLVRIGKRFADALDAEWTVVSVETPAMQRLGEDARNRRIDMLRLAESLGAETVTLDGPTPAQAILEYARLRNVVRIVVGEPSRHPLLRWFLPATPEALLRGGHGIDVSVIARRGEEAVRGAARETSATGGADASAIPWDRYGWGVAITLLCTGVAALLAPHFELTNLVMVYLLGAALAGLRLGRGPAVFTVLLSIAALDFCFVPPRWTFAVTDAQYVVTFAVMLAVALTIATLMASVRLQTRVAGARERRTAALYSMSRELAAARELDAMHAIAMRHVAETFASRVALLLPDAEGKLVQSPSAAPARYEAADLSVAQWVHDHNRSAGLGADALPGAEAAYLPLTGSQRTLGVLAVLPSNRRRVLLPEQRHLLETFAGQIAVAIERTQLAEAAQRAQLAAETEGLRNTLLASISHDLRTPLAVIAGAGTTLADASLTLDDAARRQLAATIVSRSADMNQLITNVLDLMRFETGAVPLRRDWESIEDLVSLARDRLGERLQQRELRISLPEDLPLLRVDAALMTQVFTNLLDNVLRHAPRGRVIAIGAVTDGAVLRITVDDDGPGLPPGDTERLFVKFQRGRDESEVPGAGLGLAICRAIVEAHGGHVRAMNLPGRGARFELALPLEKDA
jgi:two-component system sensor histidine kinase KdpD